jgi:hypothetical protein
VPNQTVPDNRLSFTDQALFLGARAIGQEPVMQCVWIYDHPVDLDGLRSFHEAVGNGVVGRRIERSPLPFGRHRWVSALGPTSELDIAATARPRGEVGDWADERGQLHIDSETGPGWHLGVLPLTDGSTAISLVISHVLTDGAGGLLALADAINHAPRDLGYPPPRSRPRLKTALADARQTAQALPEVARTAVAVAKLALQNRAARSEASAPSPGPTASDGEHVVVPSVALHVDLHDWDARATALGGNSYSMLAGFAAKLAEHLGRCRVDGTANLTIAISDRTGADDTRANAMLFANVSVAPTDVTTDLSGTRGAIRAAVTNAREVPDENLYILPLVPFIPERAVIRMADDLLGFSELPVSCSNLGDLDPAIGRPDGTDAEYVVLRGVHQGVTRQELERSHGQLVLVACRFNGRVSIGIVGYQPGAENTKARLREMVALALSDFGLVGELV